MKKTRRQTAAVARLLDGSRVFKVSIVEPETGVRQMRAYPKEEALIMMERGEWTMEQRECHGNTWMNDDEATYTAIKGGVCILFAGRKMDLILADLARETEQQELKAASRRGEAKAKRLASKRSEPAAAPRQAMRI